MLKLQEDIISILCFYNPPDMQCKLLCLLSFISVGEEVARGLQPPWVRRNLPRWGYFSERTIFIWKFGEVF